MRKIGFHFSFPLFSLQNFFLFFLFFHTKFFWENVERNWDSEQLKFFNQIKWNHFYFFFILDNFCGIEITDNWIWEKLWLEIDFFLWICLSGGNSIKLKLLKAFFVWNNSVVYFKLFICNNFWFLIMVSGILIGNFWEIRKTETFWRNFWNIERGFKARWSFLQSLSILMHFLEIWWNFRVFQKNYNFSQKALSFQNSQFQKLSISVSKSQNSPKKNSQTYQI